MPIGRPMRLAIPTINSVPTMACTTPPPVSPAGAGVWVKNAGDRLPAPLSTRFARMKTSGASAATTAAIISPTIRLLYARRTVRRFMGRDAPWSQRLAPCARAAGHPPDEEPCAGVHQHRHHEEQEGDVGERREVHVAHGLGELVGDRGGHRIAGR